MNVVPVWPVAQFTLNSVGQYHPEGHYAVRNNRTRRRLDLLIGCTSFYCGVNGWRYRANVHMRIGNRRTPDSPADRVRGSVQWGPGKKKLSFHGLLYRLDLSAFGGNTVTKIGRHQFCFEVDGG